VVNGKKLPYIVCDSYLSILGGGFNSVVFERLKLDKAEFARKAYGYFRKGGDWPIFRDGDFEAATRLVIALFNNYTTITDWEEHMKSLR